MSLQEDADEQLRELASKFLIPYVEYCDPGYVASPVHHFIARRLEQAAKEPTRLILTMPPQHGKSRLVAQEYASWRLGQDPKRQIVVASYGSDLSKKSSRAARSRLLTPEYKFLFPQTIITRGDSAAGSWRTLQGGSMRAVGVEGTLTGHACDDLIIDDPTKDHKEAMSPTIREGIWQWFLSTAYTRLSERGSIIIIQTRWHVDDLVGRLLDPSRRAEMEDMGVKGEKWEVINLPGFAKDHDPLGRSVGEALCPQRFSAERLKAIRSTLGSYLWTSLYDGEPRVKGGNYINGANFVTINADEVPAKMRWVRFWDVATSDKEKADYTASVAGAEHNGVLYLRDFVFGQWRWPEARARIKEIAERENIEVGFEAVGAFKTAFDNLREVVASRILLREMDEDTDKLTRALPWIAQVEAKKVCLVAGDWITAFESQCESFPDGTHDDMVDAVSGVWKMVHGQQSHGHTRVNIERDESIGRFERGRISI